MPKWTKFVVGWALAAMFAVALSWGAVAQVRNRVIQPSTPIPTTSPASSDATEDTAPSPTVIRLEPEVAGGVAATNVTGDGGSSATTSTEGTEVSASSDGQPTSSTSTTTTVAAPSTPSTTTTTTAPATSTTTTTAAPVAAQTSSYQLLGGVVTISYSPGVVSFVSAFPQSGYSTDIREYGPDEVRVRFESADQTSDFRARWENGELQITKSENGGD